MASVVKFHETGGPEVLRFEDVGVGEPGPGEVRVRHVAVGLNFADTYFRRGTYAVPLPSGIGNEAAGVIEAVGAGVTDLAVGDRVTYTGFTNTLGALKRRGLMVCVGTAAGTIPPFDPQILARKGSLYLTRPGLADYIADPVEKAELVDELFGHVAAGRIRIEINQRYALKDAVQAHHDLEDRKTTGSSIFVL